MDKSYILKCIDIAEASKKGQAMPTWWWPLRSRANSITPNSAKSSRASRSSASTKSSKRPSAPIWWPMKKPRNFPKKGLTSSCCPAFVKYIENLFPELKGQNLEQSFADGDDRPLFQENRSHREKSSSSGLASPRRWRCSSDNSKAYVDCVITFEELQALIDAEDIDLGEPWRSRRSITLLTMAEFSPGAAGFTDAVKEALKEQGFSFVKPNPENGLGARSMQNRPQGFKSPDGAYNFIEGMACAGGCIGGPCCLTHELRDAADVDKYGHESKETTITGALSGVLALSDKK
jgi:hypothetical protein